jgi:hypothetical protein
VLLSKLHLLNAQKVAGEPDFDGATGELKALAKLPKGALGEKYEYANILRSNRTGCESKITNLKTIGFFNHVGSKSDYVRHFITSPLSTTLSLTFPLPSSR